VTPSQTSTSTCCRSDASPPAPATPLAPRRRSPGPPVTGSEHARRRVGHQVPRRSVPALSPSVACPHSVSTSRAVHSRAHGTAPGSGAPASEPGPGGATGPERADPRGPWRPGRSSPPGDGQTVLAGNATGPGGAAVGGPAELGVRDRKPYWLPGDGDGKAGALCRERAGPRSRGISRITSPESDTSAVKYPAPHGIRARIMRHSIVPQLASSYALVQDAQPYYAIPNLTRQARRPTQSCHTVLPETVLPPQS